MPQPVQSSRQLLRIPAVAERLGLQPRTVYAKIAERQLETVRVGRAVRVPVEEVERVIAEGTVPRRKHA